MCQLSTVLKYHTVCAGSSVSSKSGFIQTLCQTSCCSSRGRWKEINLHAIKKWKNNRLSYLISASNMFCQRHALCVAAVRDSWCQDKSCWHVFLELPHNPAWTNQSHALPACQHETWHMPATLRQRRIRVPPMEDTRVTWNHTKWRWPNRHKRFDKVQTRLHSLSHVTYYSQQIWIKHIK